MPRDANGLYTLPLPAVSPGTTITSVWGNTTTDDLAASMTQSLSRGGEGGMLAPLRGVDGTLLSPAFSFTSEVGLGWWRSADTFMEAAAGGVPQVRIGPTNQLEVWRDVGSGLAWQVVQDAAGVAIGFDAKLGGYQADGFHAQAPDDLDTITSNSKYLTSAAATNGPSDFVVADRGFLTTDVQNANTGIQLLWGRSGSNARKLWHRGLTAGTWGAWKLVVDNGAFTTRLAGYGDDGRHIDYAGDVNLIDQNSTYIVGTGSTNLPSDFDPTSWGFLTTNKFNSDNYRVQYLNGMLNNRDKLWVRDYNNVSWDPWKLVADGEAMTLRLAGYEGTGFHASSTDLDAIAGNSVYLFQGTATGAPVELGSDFGYVVTLMADADNAQQIIYGTTGASENKRWTRAKTAAVWGDWVQAVGGSTVADQGPANPSQGQGWWDNELGRGFVWYEDGDSGQWVEEDPMLIPGEGARDSCWAQVLADGSVVDHQNTKGVILGCTNTGTGVYEYTFTPPLPNDQYNVSVSLNTGNYNVTPNINMASKTVNGFQIQCRNDSNSLTNATQNTVVNFER